MNTNLLVDEYEIIGDICENKIISNHCGHLWSKENVLFCQDCNFMSCNNCLTNGICNKCIVSPNGEHVLKVDKNAKKCPDCKHMCRQLESIKIVEHNATSCCNNFLSILCCLGCLLCMFESPVPTTISNSPFDGFEKDVYYKLRYHCRKCNKTFFENTREIKSVLV